VGAPLSSALLISLTVDGSVGVRLMQANLVQAIEMVSCTSSTEELFISVLQVLMNLAFPFDAMATHALTKEILKRLTILCVHRSIEVRLYSLGMMPCLGRYDCLRSCMNGFSKILRSFWLSFV
jgi:hypothetical protein